MLWWGGSFFGRNFSSLMFFVGVVGVWSIRAFITTPATAWIDSRWRRSATVSLALRSDGGSRSEATIKTKNITLLSQLHTFQKPRQKRSAPTRPRKPRFYWQSIDNIKKELCIFWNELNVTINRNNPPPIPSEQILNTFHRNDIRWAISQMGGRESVSHRLGGAIIIPGKWKDAIKFIEVKQILLPSVATNVGLKRTNSSAQHAKASSLVQSSTILINNTTRRVQTKEFWSKEKVIKELYIYLEGYRDTMHRPAVFIPQLAELKQNQSRLFNACSRYKALSHELHLYFSSSVDSTSDGFHSSGGIHTDAGLVPYQEWRFFESQLQLFVELENYLSIYHNNSENIFPEPADVLMNGHTNLHDLIRIHGGKTMLAQKLDMQLSDNLVNDSTDSYQTSTTTSKNIKKDYQCWGPFSLRFAIELLHFIRSRYLLLNPPLSCSHISMPCESDLLRCGHENLAIQVAQFGGYENVARKLGLLFFYDKNIQMDERSYQSAKMLWKNRHESLFYGDGKDTNMSRMKRKGVAWDEDLVVSEL